MRRNNNRVIIQNEQQILQNYSQTELLFVSQNPIDDIWINMCKSKLMKKQKVEEYFQFAKDIFEEIIEFISIQLKNECSLIASPFGSFYQGTCFQQDSDADFTIQISNSKGEIVPYSLVLQNISQFCQQNQSQNLIFTNNQNFRIPLLTIEDKQKEIKIDIVNFNILGILNSKLIDSYYSINPKIKMLSIIFKIWARKNQFNQKFKLSSYALANMVIYFMIEKNYIISLQDNEFYGQDQNIQSAYQYADKQETFYQIDVMFLSLKYNQILTKLQPLQKYEEFNNKSIIQLILEFSSFYENFNYQDKQISILPPKYRNPKQTYIQGKINIEDPFDQHYNPGSRNEFKLEDFKQMIKYLPQICD